MSADTSSNDAATPRLKRTPLYDEHRALGARLVEFSGWEMPVQYSGILEEHRAVRERAGIFDVSHMGEFRIEGPGALDFLQGLVPNNVARLTDGQALYTQICNEQGGTLDDLTIYRFSETHYMAVVNAGTAESDWTWFTEQAAGRADVTLTNISDETGLLALQGPRASDILSSLTDTDLDTVAYYHFAEGTVAGVSCLILRTGYTGEDGFEVFCPAERAVKSWNDILNKGAEFEIKPCGLGARDTLRLEMCYPLNGSDLSPETTPIEAGLSIFVDLNKPSFIGKDALAKQRQEGVKRRLVPFKMTDTCPPPRSHYAIYKGDRKIAETTSGSLSPTLKIGIGMAYIPTEFARINEQIEIEIRGKRFPAVIEKKPLHRAGTASA